MTTADWNGILGGAVALLVQAYLWRRFGASWVLRQVLLPVAWGFAWCIAAWMAGAPPWALLLIVGYVVFGRDWK